MDLGSLKVIAKVRKLSQSDIARMAGISRQAVSLWFKQPSGKKTANIRTDHLLRLSHALGVGAGELLQPMPGLEELTQSETTLLWDKLYPSIEDFLVALVQNDLRAIARLAQAYGLFYTAAVVGSQAWKRFHDYKKYIHPTRRKACEKIWMIQKDLGLI